MEDFNNGQGQPFRFDKGVLWKWNSMLGGYSLKILDDVNVGKSSMDMSNIASHPSEMNLANRGLQLPQQPIQHLTIDLKPPKMISTLATCTLDTR